MRETKSDSEKDLKSTPREYQDESSSSNTKSHPLETLHRTVGNQAVQKLLSNRDLQANPEIGTQGDNFEREAERVSEAVVRMSEAEDQDRPVGRSISPGGHRRMLNAGRSLPKSEQSFFEPRFGYDFSNVRIHTDEQADKLARLVNTKAYAVGRDIVFQSGAYAPRTSEGKQLLAHELTHLIQQDQAAATDMIQRQGGGLPTEPEEIAELAEWTGRGIADIPEDLARGGRRWLESVNVFDPDRIREIGQENERVMDAIERVVTDTDWLHDMIEHIVAEYIERFPEDQQASIRELYDRMAPEVWTEMERRGELERASRNIAGYIAGRIAGTTIISILTRTGIRMLAARLAVIGASGASGVGIPIGFAVMQGIVDRAVESAERLKAENRRLWIRLYDDDLEMLWFLVEPHIDSVHSAIHDELSSLGGAP